MSGSLTGKIGKVLIFLVLLCVMSAIGLWQFRIPLIEFAARSYLEEQGLQSVELKVGQFEPDRLQIDRFAVAPAVETENIQLDFSLLDLLSGELDRVIVGKATLDLSDLEHPLFQWGRRLADSTGEDQVSAKPSEKLPFVTIDQFRVTEQNDQRDVSIRGSLLITPDEEIKLQSLIDATFYADAGSYSVQKARLNMTGNLANLTAEVTLQDAILKGDDTAPVFKPLLVKGSGTLVNTEAQFEFTVLTEAEERLVDIQGAADLDAMEGKVAYRVKNLSFSPKGLQPSHILPSLSNLPEFAGDLNLEGEVVFRKEYAKTSGINILTGLKIKHEVLEIDIGEFRTAFAFDTNFTGLTNNVNFDANLIDLKSKISDHKFYSSHVKFKAVGPNVEDLAFETSTDISSADPNPLFPKLDILASGFLNKGNLDFSGTLKGLKDQLLVEYNGDVETSTGAGKATFHLRPLQLGQKGISLATLSSKLKGLNLKEEGLVSMDVSGSWGADFEPVISLSANLDKGYAETSETVLSGARLSVSANDVTYKKPFKLMLQDISADVATAGQNAAVGANRLDLSVKEGWQSATLSPAALSVTPSKDGYWKPKTDIKASGLVGLGQLDLTGEISTDPTGKLIDFNLIQKAGSKKITAKAILAPQQFSELKLTLSDLLNHPPDDLTLNGGIAGQIEATIEGEKITGNALLELVDLDVAQSGMQMEGINGRFQIREFFPLQTEPNQQLTADRIIAGIPINKPMLNFQIITEGEDPVLKIDRLVMSLFGGGAEIRDGTINPFQDVNELELALTSLSLEELVALGDFDDVEVSGRLKGIIPIRFDGNKIIVANGALESEGPGVLKVRSEEARQALASGGSQTKLLFDILENFNYKELSLKINKPESGEDLVALHAEGSNPEVEDSRPVILNVNLSTNLDRIFNTLLEGYLLSEEALRATLRNRN
ncbi:intermembrane phospholipid transport protein YdbH family protein [Sneathiella limimaris]|uniref:intermembrane phospholipid transport protein YdbH family protein n=1 Tax=Sneathiella limimaris TaxID=1964213 RepID=UPI00146DBED2|nr:YdbH domain-containing protein [Sneathiella limimaris]